MIEQWATGDQLSAFPPLAEHSHQARVGQGPFPPGVSLFVESRPWLEVDIISQIRKALPSVDFSNALQRHCGFETDSIDFHKNIDLVLPRTFVCALALCLMSPSAGHYR
jgi:hypothetical protein